MDLVGRCPAAEEGLGGGVGEWCRGGGGAEEGRGGLLGRKISFGSKGGTAEARPGVSGVEWPLSHRKRR